MKYSNEQLSAMSDEELQSIYDELIKAIDDKESLIRKAQDIRQIINIKKVVNTKGKCYVNLDSTSYIKVLNVYYDDFRNNYKCDIEEVELDEYDFFDKNDMYVLNVYKYSKSLDEIVRKYITEITEELYNNAKQLADKQSVLIENFNKKSELIINQFNLLNDNE